MTMLRLVLTPIAVAATCALPLLLSLAVPHVVGFLLRLL